MKSDEFSRRLAAGESASLVYKKNGLDGLVSIWRLDTRYILTWEECIEGDEYNENRYTKDIKEIFGTPEEVATFLEKHQLALNEFELT